MTFQIDRITPKLVPSGRALQVSLSCKFKLPDSEDDEYITIHGCMVFKDENGDAVLLTPVFNPRGSPRKWRPVVLSPGLHKWLSNWISTSPHAAALTRNPKHKTLVDQVKQQEDKWKDDPYEGVLL